MYQLVQGCQYEGPNDCRKFFYEFDNAVKSALFVVEENRKDEDQTALLFQKKDEIFSHYKHHRSFWKEITDKDELKTWGSERIWFKLSENPEYADLSDISRSSEYMIINKIKVEDCAKADNAIAIYDKKEMT